MFQIIKTDGTLLGFTDKLNYIKLNKQNGCFNFCDKSEGTGLAFKNIPYNLLGHVEIPEADTVCIVEVDGASKLYAAMQYTQSIEDQLAETDEAAIELYEANLILEEHNAEQDEAIIEIYELMEGLN